MALRAMRVERTARLGQGILLSYQCGCTQAQYLADKQSSGDQAYLLDASYLVAHVVTHHIWAFVVFQTGGFVLALR